MRLTKRSLYLRIVLGGLLLISLAASAQTWTAGASTCAVDESSLADYQFSEGKFLFKTGLVRVPDEILERCSVTNPFDSVEPTWNTLTVGYIDPDGVGAESRVRALLMRVNRFTGVRSIVATFDSNSFPIAVATSQSINFVHAFDFTHDYAYWVAVLVDRTSLQRNPQAWYVKLSND